MSLYRQHREEHNDMFKTALAKSMATSSTKDRDLHDYDIRNISVFESTREAPAGLLGPTGPSKEEEVFEEVGDRTSLFHLKGQLENEKHRTSLISRLQFYLVLGNRFDLLTSDGLEIEATIICDPNRYGYEPIFTYNVSDAERRIARNESRTFLYNNLTSALMDSLEGGTESVFFKALTALAESNPDTKMHLLTSFDPDIEVSAEVIFTLMIKLKS